MSNEIEPFHIGKGEVIHEAHRAAIVGKGTAFDDFGFFDHGNNGTQMTLIRQISADLFLLA